MAGQHGRGYHFHEHYRHKSALTTTLTFMVYSNQNGYKYRAVFTNSFGTAITSAAAPTVNGDN
jgi:hypothetical protein